MVTISPAGADTSRCTPKCFCNGQAYDKAEPCPDGLKFNQSTYGCEGEGQCYFIIARWSIAPASAKPCDACPVRKCRTDHIGPGYEESVVATNGNFSISDVEIYPYGSYFTDCGYWLLGTSYTVTYQDCSGQQKTTTRANNAFTFPCYFLPSFYLRNRATGQQTLVKPYNPDDFFTP